MPILFLICAIPTGLGLALLTPVGQVADEPDHIARAGGLLLGQVVGHRIIFNDPSQAEPEIVAGIKVNWPLVQAAFGELEIDVPGNPILASRLSAHPVTPLHLKLTRALRWTNETIPYFCENTIQYLPAVYLPGALGIEASRLLGGSPLQSLYVGRLMMLASYLIIGTLALRFTRWGRAVLFAVLMLPMEISLGASFNQDGQLIAAAALFIALLTQDPQRRPWLRRLALLLFAVFLCSKPPYGLLIFAAALPFSAPRLWPRIGNIVLFGLIPAAWVGLMAAISLVPYHRAPYHPGPLWPGPASAVLHYTSAADNLHVLLARPAEIWLLPVQFLQLHWHGLLNSGIGMLGWLTLPLYPWQYAGWITALIAAFLSCMFATNQTQWRALDAALVAALLVISVFAVELALYLSWTSVGATEIIGPMGRYYLPFIPFSVLLLPRFGGWLDQAARRPGLGRMLELGFAAPAIVMALLDVVYLPLRVGTVFQTLPWR